MTAPCTQSSATPGAIIAGKYRVVRALGSGGMGVVVAARHLTLHTEFAIKMMRTYARDSDALVERFLREARAAGGLRSEHVGRVFDVGRLDDGSPFMVMELLHGEDLRDRMERGPLSVETAVDYALQASEGLAEAHAIGIVHRDIKPRNLFLSARVDGTETLKVLDFGIAKRFDGLESLAPLTQASELLGSPQYMSPEQMRSERVDGRSDLWSLGACLYHMLAGRSPFRAASLPELLEAVITSEPTPLSVLRPEVPRELDAVVMRCLRKDPDDRYQTMAELAGRLEAVAPSRGRGTAKRVAAETSPHTLPEVTPATLPLPAPSTVPDPRPEWAADSGAASTQPELEAPPALRPSSPLPKEVFAEIRVRPSRRRSVTVERWLSVLLATLVVLVILALSATWLTRK